VLALPVLDSGPVEEVGRRARLHAKCRVLAAPATFALVEAHDFTSPALASVEGVVIGTAL
jgi:hypothetical protein